MTKEKSRIIINFRPFLFFALSIALGILSAYSLFYKKYLPLILIISFFVVSNLLFLIFIKNLSNKSKYIFSLIFCFIFLFGFFSYDLKIKNYKDANLEGAYLSVSGSIDEIQNTEQGKSLLLKNVKVSGIVSEKLKYKLIVYVSDNEYEKGDKVYFEGYVYDYQCEYLTNSVNSHLAEGIKYYSVISDDFIKTEKGSKNLFEKVEDFFYKTLKNGIKGENFSISYSLLLGNSDMISDDVISSFRNTGVSHIFAVSGLHIGFLALALSILLKKVKIKKIIKSLIIILILTFYSGVCGFTPSSVRAVIMSSVLLLGNSFGKKYDIISSVSIAFLLILLFFPFDLFTIGFSLSFVAVFGIVLLSRKLKVLFVILPKKISDILATSVSAQISTLPLLLLYFNKVSFVSVFANVLFVPLVGVVFVLLFLLSLIGGVFGVESVLLTPISYVMTFLREAVSFFDEDAFLFSVLIVGLSILLYYAFILFFSGLFNVNKKGRTISCIVLSCLFVISAVYSNVSDLEMAKITFTANDSLYSTFIEYKDEKVLIVNQMGNAVSFNRLHRATDTDKIDKVLMFCDENNFYKQYSVVSVILNDFNVNEIYLDLGSDDFSTIQKAYSDVSFFELDEITGISVGDLKINYVKSGKFCLLSKGNKTGIIFSEIFNSGFDYGGMKNDKFEFVCTSDYSENLLSMLKSDKKLDYGRNKKYYSVVNYGNRTVKI